jgi:hypothetical protein
MRGIVSSGSIVVMGCIVGGCLGPAEPEFESAQGAEKIAGMDLSTELGTAHGWPTSAWWVFGTSTARRGVTIEVGGEQQQQYEGVSVRGDEYLLTPSGGSRVMLSTGNAPFTPSQWFGTELAVLIRHRPAGSRHQWRTAWGGPVYDPDREHRNTDEVAHFRSPLFVDYALRGVSFPIFDRWGWLSFEDMGITEPMPELLVTVIPTADPGSLADSYDWGVKATCDETFCPSSDGERGGDQSQGPIFPGEPWIGVSWRAAGSEVTRHVGVESALLIATVLPGSPAEQAGLLPGDLVTSVDGEGLASNEVRPYIVQSGVGSTLQFAVIRRYETTPRIIPVVVGAARY